MKHIINYKIKTIENSNKLINDYSNQYGYFYILRNTYQLDIDNLEKKFNIVVDFKFKNHYYLIFWAFKKTNSLILISDNIDKLKITNYLVKTEDSYILNKLFDNINYLFDQQYLDLTYDQYNRDQILSSSLFNIITSNKIFYHHFFINKKLLLNTKILNLTEKEINNYNSSYILKAPYSSGSSCIKINNYSFKNCFIKEGVIVSKINQLTLKYELKIHTFQGNILYCVVKNSENKNIILDSNLELRRNKHSDNNFVKSIIKNINKYKKEIILFLKKVYKLMNELILIAKFKLYYELENYIKPLNLSPNIFYNIDKQSKINLLKNLNIEDTETLNQYLNFLKLKPHQIKEKFKLKKFKSKDYTENYMRIDIMLPDNVNYHQISLLEIEPFACGKGHIRNIRSSVDIISNKYSPDSSQNLVFAKFFQELLNNNIKLNWEKIDI